MKSWRPSIVDIVIPPFDPNVMSPMRRRIGFMFLTLGFAVVIVGAFVSFEDYFFTAGSVFLIAGLVLVGSVRRSSEEPRDIRKLYGR
jgi:hypothetical protein